MNICVNETTKMLITYIYFDFVMIWTQMIQGEIRQIKNYAFHKTMWTYR